MEIKAAVDSLYEELVAFRRHLHMHPELSGTEFQTVEAVCEKLDKWGIEYERGVADTGIVAIVRGAKAGKTVGLRCDIDALAIEEMNDVPYKSVVNGVMHACGHDAHTTIVLGAAKILKDMERELCGNVKFFFQPAEETTGGADRMIQAGCLENPHVDYVLGLHMAPQYETGTIGVKYGKMMAASDEFFITLEGKSCHGAHPDLGVDAILMASQIVNSLQSVVSRGIAPVNSAVCHIGMIQGGSAGNIVADRVTMKGIMRSLDPDTRIFLHERVKSIVENTAEAFGGKGFLQIRESYGPLINTDEVVDLVKKNGESVLGEGHVTVEQYPDMGTEDFSYFALNTKACFFHLGCADIKQGIVNDIHNCRFDIDEKCLAVGVRLQVENVLSLLNK